MGGKENAKAALEKFRNKTKKVGFKDLHINGVVWGVKVLPNEKEFKKPSELLDYLSFNSTTSYVWIHHVELSKFPETEYNEAKDQYFIYCDKFSKTIKQPYYPNVTMGWDATPRCSQKFSFKKAGYPCMAAMKNNTPENFHHALQLSKLWIDSNSTGNKVITINSWNEWTEGSFLEPEREYGYQYLETIKSIFKSK